MEIVLKIVCIWVLELMNMQLVHGVACYATACQAQVYNAHVCVCMLSSDCILIA